MTEDTRERARMQCDEEARTLRGRRALRFGSDGALITDVGGNDGRLAVLANGLVQPPGTDPGAEARSDDDRTAEPVRAVGPPAIEVSRGSDAIDGDGANGLDGSGGAPKAKQDLGLILAGLARADRMLS